MPIVSSGAISLLDIQNEFGGETPISLSEYYAGGAYVPASTPGIPGSGTITIGTFYGATARVPRGYVTGGVQPTANKGQSAVAYNNITRLSFETEAVAAAASTLPDTQWQGNHASSLTKGYTWDGSTKNYAVNFLTEASSSITVSLGFMKGRAGVSSSSAAYFGGGETSVLLSSIARLLYSTEAVTTTSASLSLARTTAAAGYSSSAGYFMGGNINLSVFTTTQEIDGIIFSNETATNPTAGLQIATSGSFCVITRGRTGFGSSDAGAIVAGGARTDTGTTTTLIQKFHWNMDSSFQLGATLSDGARQLGASLSSLSKGYFIGGVTVLTGYTSIDGIEFAGESAINPAAALSYNAWGQSGLFPNVS